METSNIPKVIHYCWFGRRPLPKSALRCIDSWKKFLPGYEIKRWDEDNFNVHEIAYTSQAYSLGKYAFVSDYARLKILFDYGGIYFDTDVELINTIDDIVSASPFMGIESLQLINGKASIGINPGLGFGASAGMPFLGELVDNYSKLRFIAANGELNLKTIVQYTTELMEKDGLLQQNLLQHCGGFNIYPIDFFNPKDMRTGKVFITQYTRSIHHFDDSWHTPWERFKKKIAAMVGESLTKAIVSTKHLFR